MGFAAHNVVRVAPSVDDKDNFCAGLISSSKYLDLEGQSHATPTVELGWLCLARFGSCVWGSPGVATARPLRFRSTVPVGLFELLAPKEAKELRQKRTFWGKTLYLFIIE